jgi:flagellin-like protein
MIVKEKRGLSPVVATVLLVAIALVLAVIIFLWAKNFINENIIKNERAIAEFCDEVSFDAQATGGTLYIVNTGTVPLHGVQVLKKQVIGEVREIKIVGGGGPTAIAAGESFNAALPAEINSGDTISIIPILMGETQTHRKAYICDDTYAQEIEVS